MSAAWKSQIGQQIYEALLPQVYRNRDNNSFDSGNHVTELGDLAKYLDASGELLDLVRHTLDQRLADSFPDNDEGGVSCQEWLIPYFAQLVDARLLSPEAEGRRDEVANAVSWRQRKGTLNCVEAIAESVGQMEAEIQEGWKRVARTARIGIPRLPAAAFGEDEPDTRHPLEAIKQPALPNVMLDMRYPSRAVLSDSGRADERRTSFSGTEVSWRQLNPHGLPCFPGSYEDLSPRTVDMRSPDWHQGHDHPKRLLLHVPVPAGFFYPEQFTLIWDSLLATSTLLEVVEEDGVQVFRGRTQRPLCINGSITLTEEKHYRFENVVLVNKVMVSFGYLELRHCIVANVEVKTDNHEKAVLNASDCLFGKVSADVGLASLNRCTVLGDAVCLHVEAEDTVFAAGLSRDSSTDAPPLSGYIRYCRVSATIGVAGGPAELDVDDDSVTREIPVFFAHGLRFAGGAGKKILRENGVAVMHPDCPESIVSGASDAGELGFYHQGRRHCPARIKASQSLAFPANYDFFLRDIVFLDGLTITGNSVASLERVAAQSLTVNATSLPDADGMLLPVLDARDCLFDALDASGGLVLLEYCSVMKSLNCKHLLASDCLFTGVIQGIKKFQSDKATPVQVVNCVRYSRVPEALVASDASADAKKTAKALRLMDKGNHIRPGTNTSDAPVFFDMAYCEAVGSKTEAVTRTPIFGETAYGVLHQATSEAICFGAEDRGEMGACHHKHYCLRADAVLDKLGDYMPVNLDPVIIFDGRLNHMPLPMKGESS